jgi:hypothetical protein
MTALIQVPIKGAEHADLVAPASKALMVYFSGLCYQLEFSATRIYNLISKGVIDTIHPYWGMLNLLSEDVGFYVNLEDYPADRRTFAVNRAELKAACFPHARRFHMRLWASITVLSGIAAYIISVPTDNLLSGIPLVILIFAAIKFMGWRDRDE